jgi:hypothetical protein
LFVWEIQPDPVRVDDALGEWFELHNPGTDACPLAGWSFATGTSAKLLFDPSLTVPAGGYLTVARIDSLENGGFRPDQILSSGWTLANASGSLRLWDSEGSLRDSVAWGSGWPLKPGSSLERVSASCSGSAATCWGSATTRYGLGDLGTPGRRNGRDTARTEWEGAVLEMDTAGAMIVAKVWNRGMRDWIARELVWEGTSTLRKNMSCRAGDTCVTSVAMTEIGTGERMRVRVRLPADSRPEDDSAGLWILAGKGRVLFSEIQASSVNGQPEWVELSQGIPQGFDLSGWSLGDTLVRYGLASGTALPASGRLVLSPDCAALRAAWRLPSMPCSEPQGWPRLSQTGDLVMLRDAEGHVRDSLSWNSGWGSWPAGRSRERRSRDLSTSLAENWAASPDALGATPGWEAAAPPGWSLPGSAEATLVLEERLFCPGDAAVASALGMRVEVPADGNLTVSVFDMNRRKVRALYAGSPPPEGRLVWDGLDDQGRICRMGAYLVLMEARLSDGTSRARREWAVLGRRL